jgi:2-polyprenyl-6-methoxyphenol hydroxylase-like FAD-dependent oxidoreductase
LIAADGIHSQIRQGLFGVEAAEFSGMIAWRAIIPMERPASLSPWLNAAISGAEAPGAEVLRTPITGVAFCCARAASGHVVIAPATKIMNSRRLMPGLSL